MDPNVSKPAPPSPLLSDASTFALGLQHIQARVKKKSQTWPESAVGNDTLFTYVVSFGKA